LKPALEVGTVTVGHMLAGKAIARAVRGLMLVQSALYTILLRPKKIPVLPVGVRA